MLGLASHSFRYATQLANGTAITFTASVSSSDRLEALVAGPITPGISPPRGLTLDGLDAYVPRALEGGSAVVGWLPPELGTPSLYILRVYELRAEPGFPAQITVARLHLSGSARSVRLPPDTLKSGKAYHLKLMAYSSPGVDLSRRPLTLADQVSVYSATTMSDIFTVP